MNATCLLLLFFCALSSIRIHINGSRILGIFPLNMPSHFVMFRKILTGLVDKKHQVDVVSHFPFENPPENYTNLINMAGKGVTAVNNLSIKSLEDADGKRIEYRAVTYGNEICDLLGSPEFENLIKNPPKDPPYDLVITELFYANCYFAFGRHLNVPVVALTSSLLPHFANEPLGNPSSTASVPEYNDGSIFHMNFWQRLENTIHALWESYRIRIATEPQSDMVKKYFGPNIPGVRNLERDLSLLLVNSHHTLNGIRPTTPAVVEVGGLHVADDKKELRTDLKKWLDESKDGFIYISFGSLIKIESFPSEILAELYEGSGRIAPIRILMKVGNLKDLPEQGFPKNVMALEWVDQVKVLKHRNIRGFVSHGGLMGIQEAVTFGVPFIGIPIFAEQPKTVKNCVEKGVAIYLNYKNLTADKFVDAINAIVHNPKYKKNMMALSKQFLDRPINAQDTAVYWIEYILKYGKDSLRSPAANLSWWQVELLDVYGSILISVIFTLYVLKKLLSILISRIIQTAITRSTIPKKVL